MTKKITANKTHEIKTTMSEIEVPELQNLIMLLRSATILRCKCVKDLACLIFALL